MIGSDDDVVIATSRLELRPLVVDDADEMAMVLADPALHQFTATTEAYVAWTIGTPWQGQGYAGEAAIALVRWLVDHGITSVVALVHADHVASAGVAARAGLRSTPEVVDGEVVWRLD